MPNVFRSRLMPRRSTRLSLCLASLVCVSAAAQPQRATPARFDVVVYGGTAGGVMTAVAARARRAATWRSSSRAGISAAWCRAGSAGPTTGSKEVIGGYSLEFFERVGRKYGRDIEWHFEPHVAEAVFGDLVKEAGVKVFLGHRLREKQGVVKIGHRASPRSSRTTAPRFAATVFADASYEGDLMAQARRQLHLGARGDRPSISESLAGVREQTPLHQFRAAVSPFDAPGGCCRRSCRARQTRSAPRTSACRPTTSACA